MIYDFKILQRTTMPVCTRIHHIRYDKIDLRTHSQKYNVSIVSVIASNSKHGLCMYPSFILNILTNVTFSS